MGFISPRTPIQSQCGVLSPRPLWGSTNTILRGPVCSRKVPYAHDSPIAKHRVRPWLPGKERKLLFACDTSHCFSEGRKETLFVTYNITVPTLLSDYLQNSVKRWRLSMYDTCEDYIKGWTLQKKGEERYQISMEKRYQIYRGQYLFLKNK